MENTIYDAPWGWSEIIELNNIYCMKKIFVKSGHQLSLQYHEKKIETMCVLSGHGELILNNQTIKLQPGICIHINPKDIHRLCNPSYPIDILNDTLVVLECSSPELDDVIRIQDDYGRETDLTNIQVK